MQFFHQSPINLVLKYLQKKKKINSGWIELSCEKDDHEWKMEKKIWLAGPCCNLYQFWVGIHRSQLFAVIATKISILIVLTFTHSFRVCVCVFFRRSCHLFWCFLPLLGKIDKESTYSHEKWEVLHVYVWHQQVCLDIYNLWGLTEESPSHLRSGLGATPGQSHALPHSRSYVFIPD
jgi:hypothetical protein